MNKPTHSGREPQQVPDLTAALCSRPGCCHAPHHLHHQTAVPGCACTPCLAGPKKVLLETGRSSSPQPGSFSATRETTCMDLKWDFLAGGGNACRCTSAPREGRWSPERNVQTALRGFADLPIYRNHFSILSVHIFTKLCKFIESSLEVYRPNTWQRFLWEGEQKRKGELRYVRHPELGRT